LQVLPAFFQASQEHGVIFAGPTPPPSRALEGAGATSRRLTWSVTSPTLEKIEGEMAVVNLSDAVFWISLAGLFVLAARDFVRSRSIGRSFLHVVVLLACGGTYLGLFQSGSRVLPKGDQPHQWAFVVVLYICMLAGMAATHLYDRFASPKPDRRPFDLGNFIAPMLVSPIVFIPLLSVFQSAYVDLANLAAPKLMIFLVAFENGFFWKAFFDTRQKEQKR
jgi:hypothetical protein